MNIFEVQQHIQNLKDARDSFEKNENFYANTKDLYSILINKLETNINAQLMFLKTRSQDLSKKLKSQTLEQRKNFIKMNTFNEFDLNLLSSLLQSEISNNIPVLELFPGSGQFLPYSVSAEPLYIADRFLEICEEASQKLNNEFYIQRRLRKYEIKDNDTLSLPQNSFGLVYCFNEFFVADESYILQIAKQVYGLLFNNGKFIFNFMPSDQVWAQHLTLNNNFTTVNYKDLINELTLIGYTVTNYEVRQLKSSFIIAQKTGKPTPRYKIGGGWAEIIDL